MSDKEAFWAWAEKTHPDVVSNLRKGYNGHLHFTKLKQEE